MAGTDLTELHKKPTNKERHRMEFEPTDLLKMNDITGDILSAVNDITVEVGEDGLGSSEIAALLTGVMLSACAIAMGCEISLETLTRILQYAWSKSENWKPENDDAQG